MHRIGCLTPVGIISAIIAAVVLAGAALATGGMMFNPGPLNAVGRNGLQLGGVTSHAEIGGRCSACHLALRPQFFQDLRRNEEVMFCESCGRILFYTPPISFEDVAAAQADTAQP